MILHFSSCCLANSSHQDGLRWSAHRAACDGSAGHLHCFFQTSGNATEQEGPKQTPEIPIPPSWMMVSHCSSILNAALLQRGACLLAMGPAGASAGPQVLCEMPGVCRGWIRTEAAPEAA